MRNVIRVYAILSFLTFSILLIAGVLIFFLRDDAAEDDVSVLLNGGVEFGFDSTVYIVGEDFTGDLTICGGAQIASGVAITAAHCVDNVQGALIGKEKIDLENGVNAKVEDVLIKSGWEGLQDGWDISKIINDLAVLSFEPSDLNDNTTEDIGTVAVGCNYTIVGFGTKYKEKAITLNGPRQKDSLDVCIESFNQDLALIKPESDQGFCFGDSGSPIYDRNSGEVVAVLSSTIGATEAELCDLNNRALGIRLDSNKPFINSTSSQINFNFNDEDVVLSDSSGNSFNSELLDLTDEFDLGDREFNIFNEDNFEENTFERNTLADGGNNSNNTESIGSRTAEADNQFSIAQFNEISDTAFFGYFGVIGINLFLSSALILWTFGTPKKRKTSPRYRSAV